MRFWGILLWSVNRGGGSQAASKPTFCWEAIPVPFVLERTSIVDYSIDMQWEAIGRMKGSI